MEKYAPPPPYPAVRTVALCALLAGCVTAAYHCPCFLELHPAALTRWLLWGSAAQAGSAALSLLLAGGRARRALAFAALAAAVACHLVLAVLAALFMVYIAAGSRALLGALLIGECLVIGELSVGAFRVGFLAVLWGAE